MTELRVRRGDGGRPTVLMLHGLGATSDVWDGLVSVLDGRAWVAPDLPGHGRSAPLPRYTFAAVAAAVADLVDPAGTVVVGHSFGGVVGLHLAGLRGVRGVLGVGIKVAWSAADLDRATALAARPPAVLPTREEVLGRHLRLAGLTGLLTLDDPRLEAGVAETDGGWRPALDPAVFGVGDPQVAALLAAASAPVVLARGEHDPMVSTADLRALVPEPVELPGLGHNPHVEAPDALAPLVRALG